MKYLPKTVLICLILFFSIGIISTHQYGLFPSLLAMTILSLTIVLIAAVRSQISLVAVLSLIISIAVTYRLVAFLYPATLVGVDTDEFAYWTAELTRLGSVEGIGSGFYITAPLFNIHTGIFSQIANVSVATSFVVYPFLVGIVIPLTTVLLTRRLISNDPYLPIVVAASIAAVSTAIMQQSYWPIAQTYSLLVWCTLLLALVTYLQYRPWQQLLIFTLCVTALTYSHKLPVAMLLFLFVALWIVSILFPPSQTISSTTEDIPTYNRPEYTLLLISGVILFLHWGYVSHYISSVVRRTTILLTIGTLSAPTSPTIPTSVTPVNPGLIGQLVSYPNSLAMFFERSHAVVLLLISGFCWVYVFYTTRYRNEFNTTCASLVLGGTASGVILVAMGVISTDAINPNRPLMMIEPLLAVLLGVTLANVVKLIQDNGEQVLALITIFVLFTQIFAAPAIADYPNTPRYYLTEAESNGQSFGCEYTDQTLYSDGYLAQEVYIDGGYCDQYNSLNDGLFNATIKEQNYEMIAHRPSVDVYLGTHSRWRLTWDPVTFFEQEYNNVYDNGEFTIYDNK